MCGIAGFIHRQKNLSKDVMSQRVQNMLEPLTHRGPDDFGIWTNEVAGIALGHRRLSIVDLSLEGRQPMESASGRYVIIFNGEIYNFRQIQQELEQKQGPLSWRGHSDTEIILAAVEFYGLEAALKLFMGMFSLALWDQQEKQLWLVRDRIGEKPLYYGWIGPHFVFASELHALKGFPEFDRTIDQNSLYQYCRYSYVPSPSSIYQGIYKLEPGCLVKITENDLQSPDPSRKVIPYWELQKPQNHSSSFDKNFKDDLTAIDQLDQLLQNVISEQMIADVPIGAFLSGGIDSSLIVALMQKQSSQPIQTFSIGFHEEEFNEAIYAKAIAKHLGTDHTELYVTKQQAMAVIPKLSQIYDEPFADSSQIPTFIVAELARQKVTVSLSGDGGDEFFGGYNRYLMHSYLEKMDYFPVWFRYLLSKGMHKIPLSFYDNLSKFTGIKKFEIPQLGDKAYKLASILTKQPSERVTTYCGTEENLLLTNNNAQGYLKINWQDGATSEENMMYCDQKCYLPDDILVKVDRAAMSVSLETRIPFLDPRIIAFSQTLPLHFKIRQGQSKWILRQVLDRYVPPALINRPKMGFGIPLASWLRGPLKEWAQDLIDPTTLKQQGFFNTSLIQKKWEEHQLGYRNWAPQLWTILMFQNWHAHQNR